MRIHTKKTNFYPFRFVTKKFHSKFTIFALIFSFILLLSTDVMPYQVTSDSDEASKPVVKVKIAREAISPAQQGRFESLIEEGKKLLQEEMDYYRAISKFKEAGDIAVNREQKSDAFFYLSLAYFGTIEESVNEEFNETVSKLIEIDYYREPDRLLCPPGYISLFQEIKKSYGGLNIQSNPPGADVFLNDSRESSGKTPLIIGSRAGSVKVTVQAGKKEKSDEVMVVAGDVTKTQAYVLKGKSKSIYLIGGLVVACGVGVTLFFMLRSKTGDIEITSNPSDAKVYLDGTDTGQSTPCALADKDLGSHVVKLEKEGYRDYQTNVTVERGDTTTVSASLTKHTITITSPASGDEWEKETYVTIQWTYDASSTLSNAATGRVLNSVYGNLTNQIQAQPFHSRSEFHSLGKQQGGLNGVSTNGESRATSNISSGSRNVSVESSALLKDRDTAQKRMMDHRSGIANNNLLKMNTPLALGLQINSAKPSFRAFQSTEDRKAKKLTSVNIDLYKGGNHVQNIAQNTENDGEYSWPVPTNIADGTDYSVRISCSAESSVYADSANVWIFHWGDINWVKVKVKVTFGGSNLRIRHHVSADGTEHINESFDFSMPYPTYTYISRTFYHEMNQLGEMTIRQEADNTGYGSFYSDYSGISWTQYSLSVEDYTADGRPRGEPSLSKTSFNLKCAPWIDDPSNDWYRIKTEKITISGPGAASRTEKPSSKPTPGEEFLVQKIKLIIK